MVKVPMRSEGVADNEHEARLFKQYGKAHYVPYARCRCVGMVLVMEYVEHEGWVKGGPGWTASVDGGQVGRDRNGVLVAYDYGLM